MPRGDDFVDQAKERVQFDVEEGFREMLSSRENAPFVVGLHDSDLDAKVVATSDDFVVIPWRFPCTHVGTFLNIPATEAEFELRGTTFVDIRSEPWNYYRYIDFIGALHQLGASTAVRPVVAETEDS